MSKCVYCHVMQLLEAARDGNLDVVKHNVSKGVNVNCRDEVHIAVLYQCLCACIGSFAENRLIPSFHLTHLLLQVHPPITYVHSIF